MPTEMTPVIDYRDINVSQYTEGITLAEGKVNTFIFITILTSQAIQTSRKISTVPSCTCHLQDILYMSLSEIISPMRGALNLYAIVNTAGPPIASTITASNFSLLSFL